MIIRKYATPKRLRVTLVNKIVTHFLQANQAGFTIIESLVAIIVATTLLAAIAPVITLSVATRVQARRVELATRAARTYIDGVRTQRILAPLETGTTTKLQEFNAPTNPGNFDCAANSYCNNTTTATSTTDVTNLYCIDFDNLPTSSPKCQSTSVTDMVVQAFRYNQNNSNTNNSNAGYALGIRVYRASAFKNGITLKATKDRDPNNPNKQIKQQNSFTGGTGLSPIQAPLVEMTTEINDIVPKYGDLCTRISNGGCN